MLQHGIEEQSINAIRILSCEQISKANSGHPGICMGSAPIGYLLYSEFMNYSKQNPKWENRDRFVMSAGHGSAMVYSLLHLFGFDITKEDLQHFRKFGSRTPGHPELGVTDGVDISTGALGQGIAQAVGLALAEAHLASVFNREGYNVVDHYTYCLCGEGCLEEGIGYEACSFAGAQKLGKLILFYDCNKISIEGNTDDVFTDNIALRFKSQNWQVIDVADSNDILSLRAAIKKAKKNASQPTVIICHSQIGYGTPVAGTATAHGTPLSEKQLVETKEFFGWKEQPFEVPEEVRQNCLNASGERGNSYKKWQKLFNRYKKNYPELAEKYNKYFGLYVPDLTDLYDVLHTEKAEATRASSGVVINELAKRIPNLLSGSADLTPSTKTNLIGEGWLSPEDRTGRNIHFGIREHAMAAICNGVAAHGGLRILCSTFFVFSDYMKGAMRLSAIMKLPVLYVLSHDCISVGEDGPTHQPIEQFAMLRAMPDFNVYRPCDRRETITSFIEAIANGLPSAFITSRNGLRQNNVEGNRGGYIVSDCGESPEAILIATGSEVQICIEAQQLLKSVGVPVNVVSMYCTELFDRQPDEYRNAVLPKGVKRVCVEASSDNIWYKYADGGKVIKMESFGCSGPFEELNEHFGFTAKNIMSKI